jgi:hypothetical protein
MTTLLKTTISTVFVTAPLAKMVLKLLISMMTPEGAARRSKIPFEFEHVIGLPGNEVPQWLASKFHGRHKGAVRSGTIGSFFGHYSCWQKLVQLGDQGAVVLEDDACLCREDNINYEILPKSALTMLGGTLRTTGTWDKEKQQWLEGGQFLKRLGTMRLGVNELGDNKFTMAIAYYVPPGYAQRLVDQAKATLIRPIDAWLQTNGMIGYIFWPNIYMDEPTSKSQCGTKKDQLMSDLYANNLMRKHAEQLGFKFPVRGCNVLDFVSLYKSFTASKTEI